MGIKPGKSKFRKGGRAGGSKGAEGRRRPARFLRRGRQAARKKADGEGTGRLFRRGLKGRSLRTRQRDRRPGPEACAVHTAPAEPSRPERRIEVPDEKPKRGPQPLELDRAYTAAQIWILRVTYATLARPGLSGGLQKLQTLLRASGGQAIARAFSRVDPSDRDFWVIWEDSATGTFYFTSEGREEVEIPFELPAGWFRPEGRVLKWRTQDPDGGRTLCVLRHRGMAPEVRRRTAVESAPPATSEETAANGPKGTEEARSEATEAREFPETPVDRSSECAG